MTSKRMVTTIHLSGEKKKKKSENESDEKQQKC